MASRPDDDDAPPTASLPGFTGGSSDALAATVDAASDPGAPAPGELRAGSTIGRYVVGVMLGAGGMGVVYRARDPALDRALAIKVVRPRRGGSAGRARLLREAQAMAKLRHPNVVPIFDVGPTGEGVFVVMPLLEGGTLGAWTRETPRPWREIVARYLAAGRGLAAAHAAGLVHRDFKPDNVLLDAAGEVEVADFGLARIGADEVPPSGAERGEPSDDLTRTGDVLGTPAYMSPEQMRAEPSDARADQFSFCVALWEALFGRRPFDAGGTSGTAALAILLDEISAGRLTTPTTGRDVPGWVRVALERGLRADPGERWPSMTALLDALAGPRSRRGVVAGAVGVAILAGGVAIALAWPGGSSKVAHAPAAAGPVRLRLDTVVARGDVLRASLAPDGKRIALIAGDRLVVRTGLAEGEDTVIAEGIRGATVLDWSPDGTHVLVSSMEEHAIVLSSIDVATHQATRFADQAMWAGFADDREIVVAEGSSGQLAWTPFDDPTAGRGCAVAGDFTWTDGVYGLDRDTAVVKVQRDEVSSLLVIRRDCSVRATIAPPDLASVYVQHGGAILTLAMHDDDFEIQAWSADGAPIGPPRVGHGEVEALIGRDGDRDLLTTAIPQTILVRHHAGDAPVTLTTTGNASFLLSPDGHHLASIEDGVLRVDELDRVDLRAGRLLDDVSGAAWSPDGTALAVIATIGGVPAVLRVDATTGAQTPVALERFDAGFEPMWLDGHKIGALRRDHTTYDWVDLDTGARGTLTDPAIGWVFFPRRAPRGDTITFSWNRDDEWGLWERTGDQLRRIGALALTEFSSYGGDGSLLVFDHNAGLIQEVDPRTGARKKRLDHQLSANEQLGDVTTTPDGDLLLTLVRAVRNVAVAAPE